MPNHFHALVINVGATPCGRPGTQTETTILPHTGEIINAETDVEQLIFGTTLHEGDHTGSPIRDVVGWFKTMTTNDYIRNVKQNGWLPFNKKLWQRNYFEHIIRKDNSLERIALYIANNPAN